MFKSLIITIVVLNFANVDGKLTAAGDYAAARKELLEMLSQAENNAQKAEVYWRLSRNQLLIGLEEKTEEAKRKTYNKGIEYANKAIEADPKNPEGYMWHSANVGKECQTHGMMEQAKAVGTVIADIETILVKLNQTDHSAAWHAMAEIYYNHPFKSTDEGINFARKSALCVPEGELHSSIFGLLAKMLYERNWTASKRALVASRNRDKFNDSSKTNIERFAAFDGGIGKTPWTGKTIGEVSDREEAAAVLNYLEKLYKSADNVSDKDKKDYLEAIKISNKWK